MRYAIGFLVILAFSGAAYLAVPHLRSPTCACRDAELADPSLDYPRADVVRARYRGDAPGIARYLCSGGSRKSDGAGRTE